MRFTFLFPCFLCLGFGSVASAGTTYLCRSNDEHRILLRADAHRVILTFLDEGKKPSFEGKFDKTFGFETESSLIRYLDASAFSRLGPTEYMIPEKFLKSVPAGTLRIKVNAHPILTENFSCVLR